ncbi:hypothetical protein JCGZ_00210 [Jatropha curcas]|uniref:Protein kinase domain-containing protein n=1 Tax=Jatropha curcas TaxID=180498 RepID=A0A067L5A3_JATCU|nr:serine/threonine-protein kinase-like protein At5g23170 [Jatropha curcas]KDP42413.1 hypothetical protein JCGZ_00210 [Jatropha curcas]
MAEFEYQELLKATEGFSPSSLIGKGSHGSIYKGIFQEKEILAIKKPSFGLDHDNSKKLENEISVLSSLQEAKSPYIINFLGTSHDSEKQSKILIMEFMPNGSLHDLLHVAKTPLSWSKRVEIALQLARAIQILHEGKPLIIHRDIKSANVLFDSNFNAKLADYGLAVSSTRVDPPSQPAGTIGYMDPCYTIPSKLSPKNDVYSYGVVLLELISSRRAIDVNRTPASIVEWAIPLIETQKNTILEEICDPRIGLPPIFLEGIIKHLLYVGARCVSYKEENRPSMADIVTGIDSGFGLVDRVKVVSSHLPSWSSVIRSFIVTRRQKKLGKKGDYSDISKGKFLLREILADITLK